MINLKELLNGQENETFDYLLKNDKIKAYAEQFDIFSQINEQIENGNITPEQVDEFVNNDRKAEKIEPTVEVIESKKDSDKKTKLN